MRFRIKLISLVALFIIGLTSGYYAVRYFDYLQQKDDLRILVKQLSNDIFHHGYSHSTEAIKNLSQNDFIIKTANNELQADNLDSLTLLNHAKLILNSSLVYILNSEGKTVACTPYGENLEKTLTGKNYSFREYFQQAIQSRETYVMAAFGVTTGKRGIYVSHPILKDNIPVGVIVIKQKVFRIDQIFANVQYTSALSNLQGIIFATNKESWLNQNINSVYSKGDHLTNGGNQQDNNPQRPHSLTASEEVTIDNIRYLIAKDDTGGSGWKTLMLKPYVRVKPDKVIVGCSLGIMFSLFVFFVTTHFIDKNHSNRQMREQQQRLSLALEGGELGTWDWDIPSGKVVFNDRWASMLGYKPSEMEPHFNTWELYIHPEDKAKVEKDLEAHFTKKTERYQSSFRMRHKDGSWKWILSKGKIVERSLEGEPIRICGTHLDISLQKKLEDMIHQEHQKLLYILDSAPVGFIIVSKKREILWVNHYTQQLSECSSKEDIIGNNCGDYLCPADQGACPVLDLGQNLDNSERILRNINGKEIPILKTVKEITFNGVQCFLEIFLDISERKKMENELAQHQKLESVGRLAAGIAHEINTPAQFIGSNLNFITESFTDISQMVHRLSLLLNEYPEIDKKHVESIYEEADWDYLQEEVPSALKQSEDGINQVSTIVLAMKRFSHPGTKEKAVANLNEIIETALIVSRSEWKFVAETSLELDSQLVNIPLIVDEISQVILNMIVNAAHAIVEKNSANNTEEKGTIQISTEQIDNFAILKIRDDGCGMPQKIIDNIFEPFFTTKVVGKGTGQGLAICHDVIIHKHGGFIEVDSAENVGTTFTIRLPVNSTDQIS